MRARFSIVAGLVDLCAIVAGTTLVGVGYHAAIYGETGPLDVFLAAGLMVGALFVASGVIRDEYDIVRYLTFAGHARRSLILWNSVFALGLLVIFLTKTTSDFSRVTVVLSYGGGFGALLAARSLLVNQTRRDEALGRTTAQRIFLVGDEEEIARFTNRHAVSGMGLRIVAAAVLRGPDTITDDLALAAASARMLRPDDVFILLPWSKSEAIDACLAAFMRVPAAIHLGPERVLDRFSDARISRIGTIASLNLVRHPLTRTEVFVKRSLDIVLSATLLVGLAPIFAVIALAIKLDSRGPILFAQRRYGFNQEPFRIVKFRSMTTLEDGRGVRQVVSGDPRVTRVGRFMRRCNIDELPQILNVLRGDMSLVGPRPHALAHDQLFERTVADYAKRHNVKPGITGLAQVNGFRGPILSDDAVRQRVEHDLLYIDNWSFALDIKILVLTLLSAKAFKNAL